MCSDRFNAITLKAVADFLQRFDLVTTVRHMLTNGLLGWRSPASSVFWSLILPWLWVWSAPDRDNRDSDSIDAVREGTRGIQVGLLSTCSSICKAWLRTAGTPDRRRREASDTAWACRLRSSRILVQTASWRKWTPWRLEARHLRRCLSFPNSCHFKISERTQSHINFFIFLTYLSRSSYLN